MTLEWPTDRPRTRHRRRASFGDHSLHTTILALQRELRLLDAASLRIEHDLATRQDGLPQSRQRTDVDPGVIVYFTLHSVQRAFYCDRWDRPEHNLWAIAKTIEAKRGVERWGAADQRSEYAGYAQLPAGTAVAQVSRAPHEILGVTPDAPADVVKAAWRARSMATHPDRGGDAEEFREVQDAYDALTEARRA